MTLKELAMRIGVKETTARLWVRQGKIKSLVGKGNGVYLVSEEEFQRFKRECDPQPEEIGVPYYKRYSYDRW